MIKNISYLLLSSQNTIKMLNRIHFMRVIHLFGVVISFKLTMLINILKINKKDYRLSKLLDYAIKDESVSIIGLQQYGWERDWKLMHRYIFHMLFLEDGTKAAVGVICQPVTCSVLQTGYVCMRNGSLHPLVCCDLQLYHHGEGGTPPRDYAFRFKTAEKIYTVEVAVEYESVHYVGWLWEARMVERFVTYNVDGVRGRGISEWHYNSTKGRPQSATCQDPAWFSEVVAQYRKGHS